MGAEDPLYSLAPRSFHNFRVKSISTGYSFTAVHSSPATLDVGSLYSR